MDRPPQRDGGGGGRGAAAAPRGPVHLLQDLDHGVHAEGMGQGSAAALRPLRAALVSAPVGPRYEPIYALAYDLGGCTSGVT